MDDLDDILIDVKKVIKEAGKAVCFFYKKDKIKVEFKGEESEPLTQADLKSEEIILDGLKKYNYGVLSEESTDDKNRLSQERVWVIDPLDGTSDFINKTDEFTIMIGLVEKGGAVLGVVYNPVKEDLFFAVKGQGAYLERHGKPAQKINVSKVDEFKEVKLFVSRHHKKPKEVELANNLGIKNKIVCGSAGLKISLISKGGAEININTSDKTWEWDICAADVILKEAGGSLTDMDGENFVYNKDDARNLKGYVATNGLLHDEIIKELNKLNKK